MMVLAKVRIALEILILVGTVCAAVVATSMYAATAATAQSSSARPADVLVDSSMSVKQIQDGILERQKLLKGIKVTFSDTTYPMDGDKLGKLQDHNEYVVERQGANIHFSRDVYDVATNAVKQQGEGAWDGKLYTSLGRWPKVGTKDIVTGTIEGAKGPALKDVWQTVLEGKVLVLDTSLAEMIAHEGWKSLGRRKLGDAEVEGIGVAGLHGEQFEVWVEPARDFATLEMTLHQPVPGGKELITSLRDVTLQKVGGIWVPQKGTVYWSGSKSRPSAEQITIHEYRLGIQHPDEVFRVKFPQGCGVWDATKNTAMEVGRGVWTTDAEGVGHWSEAALPNGPATQGK